MEKKWTSTPNPPQSIGLAKPADRIAAFVLDMALLVPVGQLVQAPIKKWVLEAYLFGESQNISFLEFLNSILFIALVLIYFTFTIYFRGQSLGQKFLKIKVISYQGSIDFQSAFFRSLTTIFEIILFGLPLLGVFRHPLRRALHDRLTDTLVISDSSPAGYPSASEVRWSRVLAFTLSFALIVALVGTLLEPSQVSRSGTLVGYDSGECERQYVKSSSSISELIGGFLVQRIHRDCLRDKARESLWAQENVELTQFAMSLANEDNVEMSDKYLNEVCNGPIDNNLCKFTQWLKAPSVERDLLALNSMVNQADQEPFVKVYGASISILSGQYRNAEKLLRATAPNETLNPLLANLSLQALLGQGKWKQAFWVLKTNPVLSQLDVIRFSESQLSHPFMEIKQQQELLEYFFPQLTKKIGGRGLASNAEVPEAVRRIYHTLKESR